MSENGDSPAYPFVCENHSQTQTADCGLTKREVIAAMAMQGLVAHPSNEPRISQYATEAVKFADALLAELERTKKP